MNAPPALKHIDEQRLEDDLDYRFGYLTDFMDFGAADIEAIRSVADLLLPAVPVLVDAVYVKLFSYAATKRHFVPRQTGYEGELPATLDDLGLDHPQIAFRKAHLGGYLKRLLTGAYDAKMVAYLDLVGMIHTPKAGSKELSVPLVQMNALMGFVADTLLNAVLGLDLDEPRRRRVASAFNKLLWLQNDLITRHYAS